MNLKVGDKVKLKDQRGEEWNCEGKMDHYKGKTVTISQINKCDNSFRIEEDDRYCVYWEFSFNDIERIINPKTHFKSLPSDYTGTLEIENGFIKEILDEKEKEYLSYVIRPFKDKVEWIKKINSKTDRECIFINTITGNGWMPSFKKDTMYKGMKPNKKYTLKELGLDE